MAGAAGPKPAGAAGHQGQPMGQPQPLHQRFGLLPAGRQPHKRHVGGIRATHPEARDRPQGVDRLVAALAQMLQEGRQPGQALGAAGRRGRHLAEGGHPIHGAGLVAGRQQRRQCLRIGHRHSAHPQPRQGEALGEALHHRADRGQGGLQGQPAGEHRRRIHDVAPHLIAEDPQTPGQAEAPQAFQLLAAETAAEGVVGIAEAEQAGAGRDQTLQGLQIQRAMALDRPEHRHPARSPHHMGEQEIHRIPHDRLIAGLQPVPRHQGQAGGGAVHRHHPARLHRRPPPLPQVPGHSLAEQWQAAGRSVAEHPLAPMGHQGLPDHRRGREIGIGGRERDHPLRLLGPALVEGPLPEQGQGHRGIVEQGGGRRAHGATGSSPRSGPRARKAAAMPRPTAT